MMDGVPLVTKDMVAAWQSALVEKHSLRALRRLLLAFRAGAHLHDAEDDRTYAYKINSPIVFNKLVVTCLKHVIPTLDHHLPIQTTSGGKPKPVNSGSKYATLQPLVKSFLQNTLFLLKELTDQEMIYFVIRESEKAIRYLVGFPKIAKDLLKVLFLTSFLYYSQGDICRKHKLTIMFVNIGNVTNSTCCSCGRRRRTVCVLFRS